jgi:electron transfer flavoprotein beta subunit
VKIVVCVKHVAVLGDEIRFTPDEQDVDEDYYDRALNEWDACAAEEALRIRERLGGEGEILVVTVGGPSAEVALQRCLAMGADRAVRIAIDQAIHDPIAIGHALSKAIAPEQPDLVLVGVQSSDSVQGSTGAALAQFLDLPRVAVVKKVDHDHAARRAVVHRELEGGLVDIVEVDTPAVLAIQTGINEPRYPTFRAIKDAERKEIALVPAPDEGVNGYHVRRMFVPPKSEGAEMLGGSPANVARRIVEIVKDGLA